MNHTQTIQTEQPSSKTFTVEFYPSVDDYAYLASKISGSVPTPTITGYAYYLFLLLNVIAFPAFLWINDYELTGFVVFTLNVAALIFLIPRVNSDSYRKYYEHLFGDRENEIARVILSSAGAKYIADGGESFWPWRRITEIEETAESIYFYYDGNGFAVRKSGFAYSEEQKAFIDFARQSLQMNQANQIAA